MVRSVWNGPFVDGHLIKKETFSEKNSFKSDVVWDLAYLLNKKDCPLIYGREFKIENNPKSPEQIINKLIQIGVSPNSALVDITNYITYDLGRPLHVFDSDKIDGDLVVKISSKGEKITALNDKTYELNDSTTIISDDSKVLSIAGIIGGTKTGAKKKTKNIL